MRISVTIIGHNEVDHLRELLPELQWASEIVYVDCESHDQSLAVAKDNDCKVFSRPNNHNLNINKSYSIEKATGDWIFYIDPDERLPRKLVEEIIDAVKDTAHSGFRMKRRNHYFGFWLRHGSQYPDTQLRLFRKGKARFPNQHVHEKLQVDGSIGKLNNDMLHFPYLNINQFLRKFNFYTSLEAEYLKNEGLEINFLNTLNYTLLKPLTRFIRRYFFKGGCRDGMPGLFCALFDALNYVVRYFKLWDLKQKNSGNRKHEL